MKKVYTIAAVAVFAALYTSAQITQINANNSLELVAPLNGVKTIFSSATNGAVWVSEGDLASTIQLSATIQMTYAGGLIGEKLIFTGKTAATGEELYITDGTPGGTMVVKDIVPGSASSQPADFVWMNGFWYFSAETPAEGRELWRTNGTDAGTTFVKDINPGTGSSNGDNDYNPIAGSNYILFAAQGASGGVELWKSDGSAAGTVLLKDINPGPDSSSPADFYSINNIIIFSAKTAANGREYWRTDGSPDGSFLLKDINAGPGSSTEIELMPGFVFPFFSGFFTYNGRAYFQASDGVNNGNVYGTDGSTTGTTLLKTVVPGAFLFPSVLLVDAVIVPGKFIFPVAEETSGAFLWQSDGTPGGTTVFKSFDMPTGNEVPFIFVDFSLNNNTYTQRLFQGNKFFFAAATVADGYELWISDGTLPGTQLVKNINPGNKDGLSAASYIYTSEALFFAAGTETIGNELWRSDGTEAGTTLVKDIRPVNPDSDPQMMIINNGKVFFGANDGSHPTATDLYVLDGTFSPLPAKLGSFFVKAVGDDALLQWQTLQESNSSHFTIQRSVDATHFETIGSVKATGHSTAARQYTYTDRKIQYPASGALYYRLITNDKDGKMDYSRVLALKNSAGNWTARLLGNAQGGMITVMVEGVNHDFNVRVHDVSGRLVFSQSNGNAGAPIMIPVHSFARGVYTVTVSNGPAVKTLRFVL